MRKLTILAGTAVSALGLAKSTQAATTPSTSGTNAADSGEFGGTGSSTFGEYYWSVAFKDVEATPNVITVDSLGVYNAHWDTGLSESHSISLYAMTDSSGTALATPTQVGNTVTVPSGTTSDASDGPVVDENSTNKGPDTRT